MLRNNPKIVYSSKLLAVIQNKKIRIVVAGYSVNKCMISAIGNFVTDASCFTFKLVFIIAVRTVEISDSFVVGKVIK